MNHDVRRRQVQACPSCLKGNTENLRVILVEALHQLHTPYLGRAAVQRVI